MPKLCGKAVHKLRKSTGINRAQFSPGSVNWANLYKKAWDNLLVFPDVFRFFPHSFPHVKYVHLPFTEHDFYSVSTAPITNPAKERN